MEVAEVYVAYVRTNFAPSYTIRYIGKVVTVLFTCNCINIE